MTNPGKHSLADDRWPCVLRFAVAGTAAAGVCLVLWHYAAPTLTGPIDIVGYPTFANFNFRPSFWAYRLTVYLFPTLFLAVYLILRRWGPLRRRSTRPLNAAVAMIDAGTRRDLVWKNRRLDWGIAPRLGIPAAVVVFATATRTAHTDSIAILCGIAYVLAAALTTILWTRLAARRSGGSHWWNTWNVLPLVNGVGGSSAALLALWFVSRHTGVFAGGTLHPYPWLPLWLAALGIAAVVWWTTSQLRRGRDERAIERTLLVIVVGSVAMFLAVSALPGEVQWFQGFDDAHEMAGASLLGRGFFPWRDLMFIHGLFPDVLTGSIGRFIFADTIWGIFAIHTVILTPLCWVAMYLFAAWVSRANPWFASLLVVAVVSGILPPPIGPRFVLVPIVLIVLGETLRRRTWPWCIGLVALLFSQAVLVPETGFLVVPALACVLAADIVHRDRAQPLWRSLRTSARCAVAGAVLTATFFAFLAYFHALVSFIDYFIVFGPGHNEAGALPMTGMSTRSYVLFGSGIVAVLITTWATAARVLRRSSWEPTDWVSVAMAGFVALYGEKSLGRFDYFHVWQVFGVALPLLLLVGWKALATVERMTVSLPWRARWPRFALLDALVAALVVLLLIATPNVVLTAARSVDSRHLITASTADSAFARLGYAAPGAVDTSMLRDLDAVLRKYAGADQPVFDMTNSPGYVYFLLDRVPGTRFLNVNLAISPFAQRLLIKDLQQSQPPVVIFDSSHMGLSTWDLLSNNVRHYLISQYILDNWVPVERSHGNVIMVRRDLAPAPPPPAADLWFGGPGCSWGATPNFLSSKPSGSSVDLAVRHVADGMTVDLTGWAVDPETGRPATSVVLVSEGQVVASVAPSINRPDVVEQLGPAALISGFRMSTLLRTRERPSAFVVGASGNLHPLNGLDSGGVSSNGTATVRYPDGRVVATALTAAGQADRYESSARSVSQIEIPPNLPLSNYDLATLNTGSHPLGASVVQITDDPAAAFHDISAQSLPGTGTGLALRVGSCLQWYGYDPTRPLYVVQQGGAAVTSVTLSGVAE